jgi:hypothetical protein
MRAKSLCSPRPTTHRMAQRGSVALASTFFAFAPLASAEPSSALPPPLRVEYTAPGNCPTEADFEARVRARTELARFADEPNAQSVQVVVRPTGSTYAGHLSIVGRSGHVSDRDVEDTLCSDVVDALALVTALAVDRAAMLALSAAAPSAPTSATPDATPSDVTPVPTETANPAPPPAPTYSLLAPPPPPPPSVPRHVTAPETDRGPPRPRLRWAASVGASFVTMSGGIVPEAMAGGGAFGEAEPRLSGWFVPSARLTLFATENISSKTRTASFLLLAARAEVCPVRLGSPDLSLRACAAADSGATRVEGIAVAQPVTATNPWFDVTALLRARWAPGRGHVFVELEGGIVVPVTRNTFTFETPTHVTFDEPSPAAIGSLAVGWRFQ